LDKVSVLLATSHKSLAHSLQTVLDHEDWIEVVGSSASHAETLALAESLAPEVVVIDYELAGDGLETGREILRSTPAAKIIILSVYDYADQIAAGSAGKERPRAVKSMEWLSKRASLAELLTSISSANKKAQRLH
jgi:DNA-binding NarL/FixJ family response regulator